MPDGAGKESCGEQRGGKVERFEVSIVVRVFGVDSRLEIFDIRFRYLSRDQTRGWRWTFPFSSHIICIRSFSTTVELLIRWMTLLRFPYERSPG